MAKYVKNTPVEAENANGGVDVPQALKKAVKAPRNAKNGDVEKKESSQETSQSVKPKKKHKLLDNLGDKSHTFTDEDRRKGVIKAAELARIRRQIQAEFVKAAVEGRLGEKYLKAIKKEDKELIELCEKAAKMIGTHFDQSRDAIGGANNPMNVKNAVSVAPSPENVKKINDMLEGCC